MPNQSGGLPNGTPATIASSVGGFYDGGTFFAQAGVTNVRSLTGSFFAFSGANNTCIFRSAVLVDSVSANTQGVPSAGLKELPAVR